MHALCNANGSTKISSSVIFFSQVDCSSQRAPILREGSKCTRIATRFPDVSWAELVEFYIYSTHNRSFWRWAFPDNSLHWNWQRKTKTEQLMHLKHRQTNATKLALAKTTTIHWFSCLLQHPARKQSWSILITPEPGMGSNDLRPYVLGIITLRGKCRQAKLPRVKLL